MFHSFIDYLENKNILSGSQIESVSLCLDERRDKRVNSGSNGGTENGAKESGECGTKESGECGTKESGECGTKESGECGTVVVQQSVEEPATAPLSQAFDEALEALMLIDGEKAARWKQDEQSEDLDAAYVICKLGYLNEQSVGEHLMLYILDEVYEESVVYLPGQESQAAAIFVEEYSQIVLTRLKTVLSTETVLAEISDMTQVYSKLLVFQEVSGDSSFLIGISASHDTVSEMINDYRITQHDIQQPGESEEDRIDFLCEFLNNTNGLCTYRFSDDFDLLVPECHQNVMIHAPKIFQIKYETYYYDLIFVVVYGKDYKIEQVGNNG